jgi:hypothetical protein
VTAGAVSAKGAAFIPAWDTAPGNVRAKTSTESAIHSRAFSVHDFAMPPVAQQAHGNNWEGAASKRPAFVCHSAPKAFGAPPS